MRWNPVLIKSPYARVLIYIAVGVVVFFRFSSIGSSALPYNGFDVSDSLIPVDKIFSGGPPRGGIPAIDKPRFISAQENRFLRDDDRVLGLEVGGVQRAYPVQILNYHEIVNDQIRGTFVTITWCPLCGSGMAFSAKVDGKPMNFGVSGLLYNSDMLLYDKQTYSLWSQLMHQAISGPLKGSILTMLPIQQTTWGDWRERYPKTELLSRDTGFSRDYSRNPYPGYSKLDSVYFPLDYVSRQYHPKEQVAGIEINGHFKAYPFIELNKHKGEVVDNVGGSSLRVIFDQKHSRVQVFSDNGTEIPVVISFWFAWYAFHPDTEVFKAVHKLK